MGDYSDFVINDAPAKAVGIEENITQLNNVNDEIQKLVVKRQDLISMINEQSKVIGKRFDEARYSFSDQLRYNLNDPTDTRVEADGPMPPRF